MFGVEKYPDIDNMSCREARLWNGAVRMQSGKEGRIMGEGMAAEDVAARIAGARNQAQPDMLELARSQQNESERE